MYVHIDTNTGDCECAEESEKRVNRLIFGMKAQANGSEVFHTPIAAIYV